MIQAEFENGIEDENNFQIQDTDVQNRADEAIIILNSNI